MEKSLTTEDTVQQIFGFLTQKELLIVGCVSKLFLKVSRQPKFWKKINLIYCNITPIVASRNALHSVQKLITDINIDPLFCFNNSTSLQVLVIKNARDYDENKKFVDSINLPSLTYLDARSNSPLFKPYLPVIEKLLSDEETVRKLKGLLYGYSSENGVFDFSFLKISPDCSNLTQLSLFHVNLPNILGKICNKLKVLELCYNSNISKVRPQIIENNKDTLETLNLRASMLTEEAANTIKKCKNLEELNISCTGVSFDEVRKIIDNCTKLISLDVCYIKETRYPPRNLNTEALYYCQKLTTQLQMLGIGGFSQVNDATLEKMVKLSPNMDSIGIGGNHEITDQGIEALVKTCTNLTDLNAHALPKITEKSYHLVFENCPKIKEISFENCYNIPENMQTYTKNKR